MCSENWLVAAWINTCDEKRRLYSFLRTLCSLLPWLAFSIWIRGRILLCSLLSSWVDLGCDLSGGFFYGLRLLSSLCNIWLTFCVHKIAWKLRLCCCVDIIILLCLHHRIGMIEGARHDLFNIFLYRIIWAANQRGSNRHARRLIPSERLLLVGCVRWHLLKAAKRTICNLLDILLIWLITTCPER
jgi:hypothetical protein